MQFDSQLSVGSLLAGMSVLVSASALGYGWHTDRLFRRREYADRIRSAAGQVAVALERWQLIARQFEDDLQPVLVEAARLAADEHDRPGATHLLRTTMLSQRAVISRRIADERLEAAYVDLYGYDPRIHALFTSAVQRMQAIDRQAFSTVEDCLLRDLQDVSVPNGEALAAALRARCTHLASLYAASTSRVIEGFRAEMLKLIMASDDRIIARTVQFRPIAEAVPDLADLPLACQPLGIGDHSP